GLRRGRLLHFIGDIDTSRVLSVRNESRCICPLMRGGLSACGAFMYKSAMKLFTALFTFVVLILSSSAAQTTDKTTAPPRTAGLEKHDGLFPYYWDDKKGELLMELTTSTLNKEFLYFTGLGTGIGSINAFADRSTFGAAALCRFRRIG